MQAGASSTATPLISEDTSFKRSLGLLDATMIVAGSMIGSGIFIVSADMLKDLGSAGWLIAAWLITGFMTLTAALSYGELSAMFPKAGGQYVYLKEAYNPLIGFLYGWSFFAVIQTGTIAAVGVAFSKFAAYIFPALSDKNYLIGGESGFHISAAQVVSILLIVLLTYINTRGVKEGKLIQTTFTLAKLIALFGLILFGFLLAAKAGVWHNNWSDAWNLKQHSSRIPNWSGNAGWVPLAGFAAVGAMASAMVGSIFSSDAWNNVTFIAGEIKNPQRNIGLSLFLGTLIVTIIYVATNLMYLSVLPLQDLAFARDNRIALSASQEIFGAAGTTILAILIMISTFGCNNGLILAGARVYYTMAKDRLFFKQTAHLNKNSVPGVALWIQCVVASLLCLSGKYGDLLDYVSFVVVLFYILTIAGIFILRKKRPDAERPYKAFGYPVLPILYILLGLAFCSALLIYKPNFTWPGLGIVLIGIPIYYVALASKKEHEEMKKFEDLFEQFKNIKVCIIGDVMLDTYMWGHVERISPEAPVPVVLLDKRELRLGGAGNVALNIQSLGAPVFVVSVIGNDDDGKRLTNLFEQQKINCTYLVKSNMRVTTNKTRIISRNQQMMRLDAEITSDLQGEEEQRLLELFQTFIRQEKPQVVILQDYNKGVLTKPVIDAVIRSCNEAGILTAVDPKRKNFFSYKDAAIFKPNLKEVRDALNLLTTEVDQTSLQNIHRELHRRLQHHISLITLSERGIFYENETTAAVIPSHLRNIADVSGAGDTVIAVAALVYAATHDISLMAEMANIAGGLVCEEVGTAAIDKTKLLHECELLLS